MDEILSNCGCHIKLHIDLKIIVGNLHWLLRRLGSFGGNGLGRGGKGFPAGGLLKVQRIPHSTLNYLLRQFI